MRACESRFVSAAISSGGSWRSTRRQERISSRFDDCRRLCKTHSKSSPARQDLYQLPAAPKSACSAVLLRDGNQAPVLLQQQFRDVPRVVHARLALIHCANRGSTSYRSSRLSASTSGSRAPPPFARSTIHGTQPDARLVPHDFARAPGFTSPRPRTGSRSSNT